MYCIISKLLKLTIIILSLFMTTSCGGGGGGSPAVDVSAVGSAGTLSYSPETCSDADQLEFIYDVMHDVYLWSDSVPDADYTAYTSQDSLINDLMVSPDRWSYVTTQQEYNDHYAGSNTGMGIMMQYSSSAKEIFISFVYPGSPADTAGIMRGFRILTANGYTAAEIIDQNLWDEAFSTGTEITLTYLDNQGTAGSASVAIADYHADSAPVYSIIDTPAGKAGYLLYMSFNENYYTELSEAFTAFESAGVNMLLLDLRYNGGGLTSAARYIGSAIAGGSLIYNVMYQYVHNSRYSSWDRSSYFTYTPYSLNIDKVAFLVTGGTASSGELLINSVRPWKQTYLIGSKTYGKPVGMYSFAFCDKYIVPVSFYLVNSHGDGGFFDGLDVDCEVSDDLSSQLGNENESMTAAAMTMLETGSCARSAAVRKYSSPPAKGIRKIFNSR